MWHQSLFKSLPFLFITLLAQDVSGRMQQTDVLVATVNHLHAFILSHFFSLLSIFRSMRWTGCYRHGPLRVKPIGKCIADCGKRMYGTAPGCLCMWVRERVGKGELPTATKKGKERHKRNIITPTAARDVSALAVVSIVLEAHCAPLKKIKFPLAPSVSSIAKLS